MAAPTAATTTTSDAGANGALTPLRQQYYPCANCGGKVLIPEDAGPAPKDWFGAVRHVVDGGPGLPVGQYRMACACGIMTKMCPSEEALLAVWNCRKGHRYHIPTVKVKHRDSRAVAEAKAKQKERSRAQAPQVPA